MMKLLSFLCGVLLFAVSCSQPAPVSDDGDTSDNANRPAAITDSLRQLYQHYLASADPEIPLKCIMEPGKVNPGDEAPRDTLFFLFREELRTIVAEKNIFKLLKYVSNDIKVGFDSDNGLQAFISTWNLDSPDKIPHSELWPTLRILLDLGGQFTSKGDYFEAPYVGPCFPAVADPLIMGAVVGAGVRMRAGPGLNTQVLRTISYDLVEIIETTPVEETISGETYPWVKVKLADGTEGFLFGKFVRSPAGWRAGFQRGEDQEWKMVMLLGGD